MSLVSRAAMHGMLIAAVWPWVSRGGADNGPRLPARGGKATLYQGWAGPVVSAYDAIAYYEKVRCR